MSKYIALQNHLQNLKKDSWKAGFSEIESILGFALPKSARHYQAWWANNRQNSRHTKTWLNVGWRTSNVNFGNETIMFYKHGKPIKITEEPKLPDIRSQDSLSYEWDKSSKMECRIGMEWQPLGKVMLDQQGRLLFPKAESVPAIYRFRIRGAGKEKWYIGETDNLRRRFGNYRNPGPTQQTSLRINAKLKEVLHEGAEIAVSAVTSEAWMDRDVGVETVSLASKVMRCLFENAALLDNDDINIEMLNKAGT